MTETNHSFSFTLNGETVEAHHGETIWQVAQRRGVEIPHLCYSPEPGYRADGNCRACMVEIEGERVLAASCIRTPKPGMTVNTASERASKARELVFELLVADQPERRTAHDPDSKFWTWADEVGVAESRFPRRETPTADVSHPAMAVNLDACIHCNLCVRACREVQVNDVIGMAYRGHGAKVVFDFDDPMGDSTCVACGECVQACPTGALMEKSLLDEAGSRTVWADRTVDSLCPYCGVGCQTRVHVKDDRIVQIDGRDGPANRNRLCVKGRFGWDYIYHPHRLTRPLVRRDDAPKRGDDEVDPANPWTHFREASWDEAVDRAAAGLKKVYEREGPKGLAGFGSAKGTNEEAYLFQKLIRTAFRTNNVDHCTRLCHASSVAALMEGIGSGAVTAPFTAAGEAECIVVIGARPAQNHPVAATFIKQAARRGAKLVVMDPRRQGLSRYATHMLQFKPGTDVALLNAFLHVIVEEKLYDEQYIQAHVSGFEELKAKVRDFPPEKMAEVCGIAAEEIRTVARLYARSQRSIIFWGMGVSQHVHGTDNARCLIALALSTGQVGRPGTGLHPLRGQNNVQGASDAGLIPMVYPDYQSVEKEGVRAHFEDFWGTQLDPKKGLTVVEIVDAILEDEIKAMYVMGENPAMSDPDQIHARKALAHLEHLVVQDIFLTETAWHADVVLPASAHAEKSGSYTNTNRQVQIGRPAVPLPGEARQDWWLIQELARRLGLGWDYAGPHEVFAEMTRVMPSLANITWQRLEREDAVTYPCDAPDRPGNEIIFASGFPTADGRGRIVPADVLPPDELPDESFPLVLTTGRLLEHWHTGAMTRRAGVLDDLEPGAVVAMNPREIERKGYRAGQQVRVTTRRGSIELVLRGDRDVPDGMIFIPFCFAEAAANVLTNPQLDPYGKIPEFKFCAARLEPAEQQVAAE
ncbi:NAD-dependent formate dehydrogenase catalytic subunit /NAD-dependent formate dehydrogenase iron-sulfur protein [Tistlia consotensis]|uniref:NAD-dependent formate dehydrogenase catalytic subunit /NAD-dependent formate dehydrogenase iron-sulfur protein n=1 Tax=Tistlia consotensis USBA 355 TaxID=560819 RepID=A0A1Y6CMY7_9PROT|nr:formate dehydrogenase subunit alpha [Tistlia consotensis]SMF76226.1 NAD-dependent formate dehydrogenase catalytic subunit /NAD-dependent formate dehydrogenase iron-sulfur protein [Tistlia consotensis USBA 355]SNS12517.1 NAD-dependent formate dehydrogenase catalytic subunit /NAD-dependent formate dehydrogenase iron-sulfur protein [Tistlia consotensis]